MIAKIVVFVCAAVALAVGVVLDPDDVCCQTGPDDIERYYPINATWASRVTGLCMQYICNGPGSIGIQMCPYASPDCSGNNVCYQLGLWKLPYPYCCENYDCRPKDEWN